MASKETLYEAHLSISRWGERGKTGEIWSADRFTANTHQKLVELLNGCLHCELLALYPPDWGILEAVKTPAKVKIDLFIEKKEVKLYGK